MANVTWSRDVTPVLDMVERASYSVHGTTTTNGKLTITDLIPEDRGHYMCTAKWYSGEATFKHLVRVKSKSIDIRCGMSANYDNSGRPSHNL